MNVRTIIETAREWEPEDQLAWIRSWITTVRRSYPFHEGRGDDCSCAICVPLSARILEIEETIQAEFSVRLQAVRDAVARQKMPLMFVEKGGIAAAFVMDPADRTGVSLKARASGSQE